MITFLLRQVLQPLLPAIQDINISGLTISFKLCSMMYLLPKMVIAINNDKSWNLSPNKDSLRLKGTWYYRDQCWFILACVPRHAFQQFQRELDIKQSWQFYAFTIRPQFQNMVQQLDSSVQIGGNSTVVISTVTLSSFRPGQNICCIKI